MSSELAMHAYVFLGNSLNLLVDGAAGEGERELGASRAELNALWAAVEPLTPVTILAGIRALPADKRELLERSGRWWMERLRAEFGARMGLEPEEARAVLGWLSTEVG